MSAAQVILEHVQCGGLLFLLGAAVGVWLGYEIGLTRKRKPCGHVIRREPWSKTDA